LLNKALVKLPFLWRLIIINIGSNLIGFFLVKSLLRYAQPVGNWERIEGFHRETTIVLLSVLVPFAILFLWWVSRPVIPVFYSLQNGQKVDNLKLIRARRRVINLPFWVAGMNLFAWIIPSVTFPLILGVQFELPGTKTAIFTLYNFINALMITLLAFVMLEHSFRKHVIPYMFPDGRIRDQKGTIRLEVRHKLLILYLAICFLPMFQITLMIETYASFSSYPEQSPNLLHDLVAFSLIIFGFTAIYGFWLVTLIAKNLAGSTHQIVEVADKIRKGRYDYRVSVVSNDEIGHLGDRVNEMARGLKEREEIKEAFNLLTSPEIGEEILSGRVQRGGETRVVTLLFSDLRGFMSLAERFPPEKVLEAVNSYFYEMTEAIISNKGVVLQYVGDEIEAVFGAPQDDPNHAANAISAALDMRKRFFDLNETRTKAGLEKLGHGIGIHTGPALAGIVGSSHKISYAMVGDTVNVASRIQELTKNLDTDILISSTTREFLKAPPFLSEPISTCLEGKVSTIEVYKVL
jgi:adenylate cyclase